MSSVGTWRVDARKVGINLCWCMDCLKSCCKSKRRPFQIRSFVQSVGLFRCFDDLACLIRSKPHSQSHSSAPVLFYPDFLDTER